MTGIGILAGLQ